MVKKSSFATLCLVMLLASCADVSYVQKASPANTYKDYRAENVGKGSVIGVGEPISKRQMKANATFTIKGKHSLEDVMHRLAAKYNVAVRWGNGTRRGRIENILMQELAFDEARTYLEDVYKVQVIREGERRLLILPSASEPRVEEFSPGANVKLGTVLSGLANQCGYNIVLSENREKLSNIRVTTTLKDVTCFDAFAALLNPHGLSLIDKGDYFIVGGLPVRQWTINLFESERNDERTVSYSSSFSGNNEESGSGQELGGTTKVTVKNERRLWEELQQDLDDLLDKGCDDIEDELAFSESSMQQAGDGLLPPPTSEGAAFPEDDLASTLMEGDSGGDEGEGDGPACGYVRINKSVGLVQMQAPDRVLDQADEIIRRVEDIAGRRLLLEARVLAVKRERDFEQGGTFNANGDEGETISGLGSIAAAVNSKILDLAGSQGGFRVAANSDDLDAVVRVVEEYGTTYQLMQPMLELIDRQQATMIDGKAQPFIVRTAETETTDTGTVTNISTELKYQFLGLQFAASAQIADEGQPHTINVQIPILSKTGDYSVPFYSGSTAIGSDDIPIAETRLIDQKVRIRDGEIKVIGGLTKTMAIDRESGVPLLRETPLFGKLANEEDIEYENVEFIVLLQVRRLY